MMQLRFTAKDAPFKKLTWDGWMRSLIIDLGWTDEPLKNGLWMNGCAAEIWTLDGRMRCSKVDLG